MATKDGDDRDGCTFQWKIKNTSHSWVKFQESIDSPRFVADAVEGTKWFLRLYPSGNKNENYISLYLRREEDCVGPDIINVNFQLAFLGKNGSILTERISSNCRFKTPDFKGFYYYEDGGKIFVTQREAFLPEDTLTVQCMIWNTEEKPVKPQQLYARTVLEVERKNFKWRMNKFSTLKCGLINKIRDSLIEFDVILSEGLDLEKEFILNTNSFDESIKYFLFTASVITAEGKKENCVFHECFAWDLKKGFLCKLLSIQKVLENSRRYLPDDVLSLECEYAYTYVSYEQCGCGIVSPKLTGEVVENSIADDNGKQEALNPPMLVNYLKSMYDDDIFSDTEIRTLTQTFSAHKNILSARSPVFRSMFGLDMKENRGHVDVTDMEDDTVRRMLLYMYTGTLGDVQLGSACKLYSAADKYEILSLRSSCSSFLKDNLSPSKACEALSLADRHQDDDLKCYVQSFILKHTEVFGSQEWKDFMATNIQLAADMMYRFTQSRIQEP